LLSDGTHVEPSKIFNVVDLPGVNFVVIKGKYRLLVVLYRFKGIVRHHDDQVNFKALTQAVHYAHRVTSASVDVLSQVEEFVSEYEADMRGEMRTYMEADLEELLD
jgi:hypothetical protein